MIRLEAKQTIAFDGDSLTALRSEPTLDQWPWLRISNNHRSWSDVFSELLFAWRPDLQLNFRTAAVGGSTCLDLERRFDASIAKIRPDWVFMTLGSNDASKAIPLDHFESTLRCYVEKLAAWGGQLVLLHNIQACVGASEEARTKEAQRKPYYQVQARLANSMSTVQLIDIGTPLKAKSQELYEQYQGHSIYSDGLHFSHLGAMIIAGEALKACGIVVNQAAQ
ncbi:SGNH/GDSL hydrolase family protein [Coraliomargarita sp. SDUM461003]|uniref:SGNH/GDSL hydrolase family protein n=1 Tax=Thalassobacterium maritimum TaxID=3041265 RepID=A0ABU1AWZ2_9BACT|nr:SGNH/GDSL hydrolase family protein [Coraliomargarita sp. SDUM461003]MDQ8208678.1 SGNH/GDSL hydrolase family protein [Coraliomargarita sp. SDUM461003]